MAEELDTSQACMMSIQTAEKTHKKYLDPTEHPWHVCLHKNEELPWVEGFAIDSGEPWMIPATVLSQDFTIKDIHKQRPRRFRTTSNGLASGMNVTESRVSALLELVERHSVTHKNKLNQNYKRLQVGQHCPETLLFVLKELETRNIMVFIYDATVISGLHTIEVYLCSECMTTPPVTGSGCSLDLETAILRAILEANQAATALASGSRDDMGKDSYLKFHYNTDHIRFHTQQQHSSKALQSSDFTSREMNPDEELELIVSKIRNYVHREIVIYQYTPAEYPISVCKAFVPTFEGAYFKGYRPIRSHNSKNTTTLNTREISMPAGGRN